MPSYRVGIVGCSGIAAASSKTWPGSPIIDPMPDSHAASYAVVPSTRVVAVCDIVPSLLDQFVHDWNAAWPDVHTYTDYRDLLAREQIDILSVATSDHRHADIVVDAASAGVKAILCEKPMATTLADADRMIEAVERNNVVMTVEHTRRWSGLYHQARQLARDGAIGPIGRIAGYLGGPRAMLFRNGTHLIDLFCFFAESDPEWVVGELDPGFEDYFEYRGDGGRDPATDPGASGYIHFANGVRAFYNGSKGTPSGFSVELYGPQGMIKMDDTLLELWTVDEKKRFAGRPISQPGFMKSHILGAVDELLRLMEHGGQGISDGREARKTVAVMVGLLESQRRGNGRVNLKELG
ncbi:MAG: Gfo/Idh/MocA family oxidoreductase [Candidatus Latescibacteria bacterium]|nr:Gfo/Idh/MocA family oxidoreductase [Candidatus Latescibacterota bacterium]